jgi:hypothetical protein
LRMGTPGSQILAGSGDDFTIASAALAGAALKLEEGADRGAPRTLTLTMCPGGPSMKVDLLARTSPDARMTRGEI